MAEDKPSVIDWDRVVNKNVRSKEGDDEEWRDDCTSLSCGVIVGAPAGSPTLVIP